MNDHNEPKTILDQYREEKSQDMLERWIRYIKEDCSTQESRSAAAPPINN